MALFRETAALSPFLWPPKETSNSATAADASGG